MAFCHVTSKVATDKNQGLLQEKGGTGFPYFVMMDAEGNVIGKHEGERNVAGFEKTGQKAKAFLELKKKAEKGDRQARIDLLLAELELDHVTAEEAEKKIKEIGKLSPDQQTRLNGLLAGAAVKEVLKTVNDKPSQIEAGKKFLEMKKAGKSAPTSDRELQAYWILMMNYAETQKDVATFEEALKILKAKFGDNPSTKRFFDTKDEILKKLKEETKQ